MGGILEKLGTGVKCIKMTGNLTVQRLLVTKKIKVLCECCFEGVQRVFGKYLKLTLMSTICIP
jgi:hypothetical protein